MPPALDISFLIPVMPVGPGCLERGALGGSESAGVGMAQALARRGHRVTVFGNVPSPCRGDGVTWVPLQHHQTHLTGHPHDLTVVQRIPRAFAHRTEARLNWLWCHDLPVMPQMRELQGVSWNIDRVAVVSDWMKGEYEKAGIDGRLLWATRNGVDPALIGRARSDGRAPGSPEGRVFHNRRYRVVYAARPERGLDVLLGRVWPKLKELVPEASLAICGYADAAEQFQEFYAACVQTVNRHNATGLGPIEWLGQLSKPELYRLLSASGCYLYPCPSPLMPTFAETSCIMAIESMACGLPFAGSRRGAVPETLGPGKAASFLVEGDPMQEEVAAHLARAAAEALEEGEARRAAIRDGLARMNHFSYDALAEEWEQAALADLAARNDCWLRLTRHFLRRQDVMAAQAALDEAAPSPEKRRLVGRIDRDYASLLSGVESFVQHYETHAMDVPEPAFAKERGRVTTAPIERYGRIAAMMAEDIAGRSGATPVRVLDYGCHDGELDCFVLNQPWSKGIEITAVDLNKAGIEWARKLAPKVAGKAGGSAKFLHIEHDWLEKLAPKGVYDLVICGEVLEHQPEPGRFARHLWATLAPGGRLILTVPYGPWELGNERQPPMHLWEFDLHDLRDLFNHLDAFEVTTWRTGENEVTGEALGYRIVTCVKRDDGSKPGDVNMARKLQIQRPRQSLSANLIVGGKAAAETLRWCLAPLKHLCDEIVIADCGMDERAFAIAQEFRARTVSGVDPSTEGFAKARNGALNASSCDWVLWIDADERLIGTESLTKYLRFNRFASYGVQQVHFAVDTTFKPDIPARLIRSKGFDGKRFAFYGVVHEHAELGGLNQGPGPVLVLSDVKIAHVGYLSERVRRRRFVRNLPLLAKDAELHPDRKIQKYLLCRDNMQIAGYEMEKNGGRVTPVVKRACEETIELYRKYFRGQAETMGMDCLSYYSQACRILGIGFDVDLNMKVGKAGVEFGTTMPVIRYATQEDFLADIASRAKDMTRHYEQGYW